MRFHVINVCDFRLETFAFSCHKHLRFHVINVCDFRLETFAFSCLKSLRFQIGNICDEHLDDLSDVVKFYSKIDAADPRIEALTQVSQNVDPSKVPAGESKTGLS